MAQSFSYDLSVPGSPSEAQARLKSTITDRMRTAGRMRLASEDASTLSFRPGWSFPVFLAASRMISGETVTLSFSAAEGAAGTRIVVSGKVGGTYRKLATREFWAETLQAT
ncbi:MAG TPA: hypothetical protein VME22_27895 [Solirubrobacteraceae bacterium]|nr:hypothetical protein [Solirubrobacteraceae bacterium]